MIKVRYNIELDILRERYISLFDLTKLNAGWKPFEQQFGVEFDELITADFVRLVDLYFLYKNTKLSLEQIAKLEELFKYEDYQPKIAWFFMNPDNKFDFKTCHYCNMAYVNSYGLKDGYGNVLGFVNNAKASDWRYWFNEDELSNSSIDQIISEQPYESLMDFNKKKYLWKEIERYKRMSLDSKDNHFDLDHVLPKSICPITRLSLFNLVPSCQVCNEKLKKDKELATTKADWLKISPTCQDSSFDQEVTIRLKPEVSCSTFFELRKNRENYRLDFDSLSDVYENYITVFRLKDRYNYHRQLALQILDLKERYSEEKRKEISLMLSKSFDDTNKSLYSEAQVKEDIFRLDAENDDCFIKLRRDMMDRN